MPPDQSSESAPRTDLQECELRLPQQLGEAVGEADGPAQMADPVAGIARLFVGDPGAGDVGKVGDLGRGERDPRDQVAEGAGDPVHQRRMRRELDVQAGHLDAIGREPLFERVDRLDLAGDRAVPGRVDHGERDVVAEIARDLLLGQRHRKHRARRQLFEQPGADVDHLERVVEGQDPGEAGGHVLAEAVAEDRPGLDPPRYPEPRESVLGREDRRMGERRALHRAVAVVFGVEPRAEIELASRDERLGGAIDGAPELGLCGVELAPHAHILAAVAGKEEGDRTSTALGNSREHQIRIARSERGGRLPPVARYDDTPVGKAAPPGLQGEGDVGERLISRIEMRGQAVRGRFERRGRAGRNH
jgi:hypothetical protein